MTVTPDDTVLRWLREPRFWTVGTLNPDGSPQLTPMWVGLETIDGVERIVMNTSAGRVKEENLRRDPRLSLCCFDTENPYDRVEIRGRVTGFVEGDEAVRIMDRLARKYLGVETFPWLIEGERRVAVLIEPDRIHHTVGVEPFRPGVLAAPES
ncbi:PPOX class probable F420-dependent enzyme [Nocardia transvalensis]|uniref:PPOX class probable F420-dependent enzyme n=1 Tax=Nocardia transvalensis TaxID=37333 RepID=A0A7W9UMQ4_9NOCA|nr:PPOX class F420-dependent oxidoreductase [Nocardia transvalensis]MBB5918844.1 PPOX class probable F420-dependent enzyme [Nocardia transvalensis]